MRYIPISACARRLLLLPLFAIASIATAADISDPTRFLFVADADNHSIDVVDLAAMENVTSIATEMRPDRVLVTPFAPVLLYADIAERRLVHVNLDDPAGQRVIALPVTPRHIVMNTGGDRIAISDSISGGLLVMNAYNGEVELVAPDFPPTADMLFDPNDVDIYYTNAASGSVGRINLVSGKRQETNLADGEPAELSPPSRSLDARYLYVANNDSGEIYYLNAYSQAVFDVLDVGDAPMRPYTTPQGAFMYAVDRATGSLTTIEQRQFSVFAEVALGPGVDLVAVGQFDRLNLFLGSQNRDWYLVDNLGGKVIRKGQFRGTPIGVIGAADGKHAYVAFSDLAEVAFVEFASGEIHYVAATENGASSFTAGLSNNVCH